MRVLIWLLRAFIFFALFAFALNNQQMVIVHWFFGIDWSAPLVIVVLIAFGTGCAVGVLGMLPMWWRQRRVARQTPASPEASAQPPATSGRSPAPPPSEFGV
jgi:uncharacterized integral membrane protein